MMITGVDAACRSVRMRGVGLCEVVQQLALADYVCVSADLTDRVYLDRAAWRE